MFDENRHHSINLVEQTRKAKSIIKSDYCRCLITVRPSIDNEQMFRLKNESDTDVSEFNVGID
jgi:hypothetical protein